jgi:hypothetical protein
MPRAGFAKIGVNIFAHICKFRGTETTGWGDRKKSMYWYQWTGEPHGAGDCAVQLTRTEIGKECGVVSLTVQKGITRDKPYNHAE